MEEKNKRQIHILTLGDIYREQFSFPTFEPSPVPRYYTFPESRFGTTNVMQCRIQSGLVLQTRLLSELLNEDFLAYGNFDSESNQDFIPTIVPNDHLRVSDSDWSGFSTYLHELGPFPENPLLHNDQNRVWRMSKSFSTGSVKDVDDGFGESQGSERDAYVKTYYAQQIHVQEEYLNKKVEENDSVIVFLSDRDHDFRTLTKELTDFLKILATKKDFLVIWHVAQLDKLETTCFSAISESNRLFENTIVLVNQRCLRDAGVNVRFDISYEHTLRDFVSFSRRHEMLKLLLRFPVVLVRFDYGVLHIRTLLDNRTTAFSEPKLTSIDVHSLIQGPYELSSRNVGTISGRTFIHCFCLISEFWRFLQYNPKARLRDVFRYDGVKSDTTQPPIESFYNDYSVPSIFRNSIIDTAVDLGILLTQTHFRKGYGRFENDSFETPPAAIATGMATANCSTIREFFKSKVKFNLSCTPHRFSFNHEFPGYTKLTRFDLPPRLLDESDTNVDKDREVFSRVELLGGYEVLAKVEDGTKPGVLNDKYFSESLQKIVTNGIGDVVSREPNGDGVVIEPSILLPYVEFGSHSTPKSFVTLDRQEIDRFLSIRFLIESYLSDLEASPVPLSIAVFGPPGSGKSTAVKQILRSISIDRRQELIELNLSQLTRIEQLMRTFHIIQDRALSGAFPIVFFDEFDCKFIDEFGWLKYFLSPMNDGVFFDGQDAFRVGPAIFVFAGGVERTFASFEREAEKARMAKAPDFVSRLRGHLDIKDISAPNSDTTVTPETRIRRAILLRNLLMEHAKTIIDETGNKLSVDIGVVHAFLNIPLFKHGVRSMLAIIKMSRINSIGCFQRSSLPTVQQLNMHVDGQAFLNLVNEKAAHLSCL